MTLKGNLGAANMYWYEDIVLNVLTLDQHL